MLHAVRALSLVPCTLALGAHLASSAASQDPCDPAFAGATMRTLARGAFELRRRVSELPPTPGAGGWMTSNMADYDQPFNSTDVVDLHVPGSRLMAAAVTPEAVVLYIERGGIALRHQTVLIDRQRQTACEWAGRMSVHSGLRSDQTPSAAAAVIRQGAAAP